MVAKSTLQYVPVLGWSFWFAEYIFLKRVWEKDQKLLVRDLNQIFDYPKGLHYCVIIIIYMYIFTVKLFIDLSNRLLLCVKVQDLLKKNMKPVWRLQKKKDYQF